MKTAVTFLTILFIGVGYVLQNWIMGMIPSEGVDWGWQTAGVFAALAGIGALLPFILYVVGVLFLIRRQER